MWAAMWKIFVRDLVREADGRHRSLARVRHYLYRRNRQDCRQLETWSVRMFPAPGSNGRCLKPLEETEVEMKVPHDPISMMQEIEHFRKTGEPRETGRQHTQCPVHRQRRLSPNFPKSSRNGSADRGIGFSALRFQNAAEDDNLDIVKHVQIRRFNPNSDSNPSSWAACRSGRYSNSLDRNRSFRNPQKPQQSDRSGKKASILPLMASMCRLNSDDPALALLGKRPGLAKKTPAPGV